MAIPTITLKRLHGNTITEQTLDFTISLPDYGYIDEVWKLYPDYGNGYIFWAKWGLTDYCFLSVKEEVTNAVSFTYKEPQPRQDYLDDYNRLRVATNNPLTLDCLIGDNHITLTQADNETQKRLLKLTERVEAILTAPQ